MGWFLQIHCEGDELVQAMPVLRRTRVRAMIDHFGRPDIARGLAQPGFAALLELGRSGEHVVKLSGPFRCSRESWPHRDVDPFIAAAIEAFTLDRCVWGSDWPFVRVDEASGLRSAVRVPGAVVAGGRGSEDRAVAYACPAVLALRPHDERLGGRKRILVGGGIGQDKEEP